MSLNVALGQFESEVTALSAHFRNLAAVRPFRSSTDFALVDECLLEGLLSRVWQAWNTFCRTCLIESCIGTADVNGLVIAGLPQALSEAHVSAAAMAAKQGPRSITWGTTNAILRREPTWGDTNVLASIIPRLGPANRAQLLAAFSSGHAGASALQIIRNAAAHNNGQSVDQILQLRSAYVTFQISHPTQALFWIEPQSSDFLVTRAIDELRTASQTAVS